MCSYANRKRIETQNIKIVLSLSNVQLYERIHEMLGGFVPKYDSAGSAPSPVAVDSDGEKMKRGGRDVEMDMEKADEYGFEFIRSS